MITKIKFAIEIIVESQLNAWTLGTAWKDEMKLRPSDGYLFRSTAYSALIGRQQRDVTHCVSLVKNAARSLSNLHKCCQLNVVRSIGSDYRKQQQGRTGLRFKRLTC